MTFGFSTDEQHRATLDMLKESLEYLQRMPRSPITAQMCRKIQAHLDEPRTALVGKMHDAWEDQACTVVGVSFLKARLVANKLTIRVPSCPRAMRQEEFDTLVLQKLTRGVCLNLKNMGPDFGEDAG